MKDNNCVALIGTSPESIDKIDKIISAYQEKTKTFEKEYTCALTAVLGITSGILLGDFGEIQDLISFLSGFDVYTHQIPKQAELQVTNLLKVLPEFDNEELNAYIKEAVSIAKVRRITKEELESAVATIRVKYNLATSYTLAYSNEGVLSHSVNTLKKEETIK